MGMRLLVWLLVVLALNSSQVFGQIPDGFNPFKTLDAQEAEDKAKADAAAAAEAEANKDNPHYQTQLLWRKALKKADDKIARDNLPLRRRIEAEIPKAAFSRDLYKRAFDEQRRTDEVRALDVFGPRRSSADRSGDWAIMLQLEEEVTSLEEKLKSLDSESAKKRLPLAWNSLSDLERAEIISARILTPSERTALGVNDSKPVVPSGKHFTNSVGMNLMEIPAGGFRTFLSDGKNQKEIVLTNPFWMGETEVTSEQYWAITQPKELEPHDLTPDGPQGFVTDPRRPVTVDWYDAVRYCITLSKQSAEKSERRYYRLPTDAEWEYACRAGTTTDFSFGDMKDLTWGDIRNLMNIEHRTPAAERDWYYSKLKTVGFFPANFFGLYDMHGNASEWCGDWGSDDYIDTCPRENPPGPKEPTFNSFSISNKGVSFPHHSGKIVRGGSTDSEISMALSRARRVSRGIAGFRVVCEVGEASDIARHQYQTLFDHDNKIPSPNYDKALKEGIGKLRETWSLLNASGDVPKGKEWILEKRKPDHRTVFSCQIFTSLGYMYSELYQQDRAQKSFAEVARLRRQAVEKRYPSPEYYDSQFVNYHLELVDDYVRANDYKSAHEIVDKTLKVWPHYSRVLQVKEQLLLMAPE